MLSVKLIVSNFHRLFGRAARRFSIAPMDVKSAPTNRQRWPLNLYPERHHACQAILAREAKVATTVVPLLRKGKAPGPRRWWRRGSESARIIFAAELTPFWSSSLLAVSLKWRSVKHSVTALTQAKLSECDISDLSFS